MEIPKKAKDIFKEGEELIEKQEYEEALKKFEQALKIAPRFSDAMSYAAIAHFRLKNKYLSGEEAFNMARKAWESNKSSPITLNNMGIAYLIHHKDLDKSKDYYLKAVQADIKYYKAWANLGLIHTAKKDYESSIKCYKVALGLKPSNVQILNFLGNSYRFNDNPDMAILIYMKALGIDPNHAASSTNLRLAHFQKKDYEGAINFFDLMIKIRPENIMMHLNLGITLVHQKEYDKAIERLKKVLEIDPKNESALKHLEIARQKRESESFQTDLGIQLPKQEKIINNDLLENTFPKTSNLFKKEKMEANNSVLSDLLINETKLTFLIGAGCSTDAPSNLPTARSMMDAIIQYACLESEIQEIRNLKNLRFEQLIEIIQNAIDEELTIIDYFEECEAPNSQHFFLAEMIKKGHIVMTTNFDYLIERALLQSGIPKIDVIPIITRKDFERYHDPEELIKKGKKPLYKIHGSTKNIITNESTRKSLITTIKALGKGKEGDNLLQVESFKLPFFEKVSNNHALVVMGYSGSDDFDVVPTLSVLKGLSGLYWINHNDNTDEETISEISLEDDKIPNKSGKKIDTILRNIKRINPSLKVQRIDVNTTKIINNLIQPCLDPSNSKNITKPFEWIQENIEEPSILEKHSITYRIYMTLNKIDVAMDIAQKGLNIAEKAQDLIKSSYFLLELGKINLYLGNLSIAKEQMEKARDFLDQMEKTNNFLSKIHNIDANRAAISIFLGEIYQAQGYYDEAHQLYKEIFEDAGWLEPLIEMTCHNRIGNIHLIEGNASEAMKEYQMAFDIVKKYEDLELKADCFTNFASVYKEQLEPIKALEYLEKALQIYEKLGNLSQILDIYNKMGLIYFSMLKYPESEEKFELALEFAGKIGRNVDKKASLIQIGALYVKQGKFQNALEKFDEALKINRETNDIEGIASCMNHIASVYRDQKKFTSALKKYEDALQFLSDHGIKESATVDLISKNIEYTKVVTNELNNIDAEDHEILDEMGDNLDKFLDSNDFTELATELKEKFELDDNEIKKTAENMKKKFQAFSDVMKKLSDEDDNDLDFKF